MVGCMAEAASSEIKVNTEEMGDAQWFDRATVKKMLAIHQGTSDADGVPSVPGAILGPFFIF